MTTAELQQHTIETSVAMFGEAIAREPHLKNTPAGHAYMAFIAGVAAMNEQRFFDALNLLDHAIALTPKDLPQWICITRWNKALCHLALGDYGNGFREFEFRKYTFPHAHDHIPLPDWRGEPLKGKRLLIYQDQGYGDAIQMLRYIPMVKALGADITVLVDPALVHLAQQLRVTINCLESDKPFDFKCPLFGLMPPLKQTVHTIPTQPYFKAKPRELGKTRCIRIGIAWSGNDGHAENDDRSIQFDRFYQLFCPMRMSGFMFYSMQRQCRDACQYGVRVEPHQDFADLAEIMMAMDHVVSVSTAAICLAGALGHPSAHALLPYRPDWRWYYGDKWYPRVRMYRQQAPGDWAAPFAELNARLAPVQAAA